MRMDAIHLPILLAYKVPSSHQSLKLSQVYDSHSITLHQNCFSALFWKKTEFTRVNAVLLPLKAWSHFSVFWRSAGAFLIFQRNYRLRLKQVSSFAVEKLFNTLKIVPQPYSVRIWLFSFSLQVFAIRIGKK